MEDSPEKIEARKNQEDPIVMYLIVQESLGMSMGKTAAQCAHASQMLTLLYFKQEQEMRNNLGFIGKTEPNTGVYSTDQLAMNRIHIFRDWLAGSFRKVVLRADTKEFHKVRGSFVNGVNGVVVVDAGLTEIAAGSETVIGLWPMKKSEVSKIVKRLQVLK